MGALSLMPLILAIPNLRMQGRGCGLSRAWLGRHLPSPFSARAFNEVYQLGNKVGKVWKVSHSMKIRGVANMSVVVIKEMALQP